MPRLPPPIISRSNARVKALRQAFSGRAGKPGERAGLEGWKTVLQAVEAGLQLDTIAVTAGSVEAGYAQLSDLSSQEIIVLSPEVMASVSDTLSPQGIVASVAIPHDNRKGPRSRLFLVLEDIQDPGNLGTLIRSAEAFGVERVYLSLNCANPWSPKVIRASAGSVLRQPVVKRPLQLALPALRGQGVRLVGAVARGEGARLATEAALGSPLAILIGNEGAGLSADTLSQVHDRVYIPCRTESLNAAVAGSLLLYEVQRHGSQGQTATAEGDV